MFWCFVWRQAGLLQNYAEYWKYCIVKLCGVDVNYSCIINSLLCILLLTMFA